jgi:hypothetical protein
MAQVSDYTGLITSGHADKPKFMAVVAAVAQCAVDQMTLLQSMPTAFDLDQAVGVQLDAVGIWVGLNRNIAAPIDNVYFSWDTADVGWDQGVWKQPGDPDTGITRMDDGTYRLMLRAKIGANKWDGSMGGSVAILQGVFVGSGVAAKIVDNQDMTMTIVMSGGSLSALAKAMIEQGYIPIKPVGVGATYAVS